jgi:hypothetical protein
MEKNKRRAARQMKGVFLTYTIFLLFSALIILIYTFAHIEIMENDAYSVFLSVARVRNQFDAVEHHFLRIPITDLNFTIENNSVIFSETLPLTVTNSTSITFYTFKEFVEKYSYINTTFDAVPDLPGELDIYPYRVAVIHPDQYSVLINPLDEESIKSIKNYTMNLVVQGSTPGLFWSDIHTVPENSSDAFYIFASVYGTGEPNRINNISVYINRSLPSTLTFSRGANEIMTVKFNEEIPGSVKIELEPRFGVNINYTIVFSGEITRTKGGMRPANVTVTVPRVIKRVQIIK